MAELSKSARVWLRGKQMDFTERSQTGAFETEALRPHAKPHVDDHKTRPEDSPKDRALTGVAPNYPTN